MSGKNMELDPSFLFGETAVYNDALVATAAGTVDQAAGVQANGDGGAGYSGALIAAETGAVTGSPTSFSVAWRLQDSADDVTYADVTGVDDLVITTANTKARAGVNVRRMRAYTRWRRVIAFVAGTSPDVEVGHCVVYTRPTKNG